ncbi:hypothetical protein ACQEVX_35430 [Streptomyces syringium]
MCTWAWCDSVPAGKEARERLGIGFRVGLACVWLWCCSLAGHGGAPF